jgi:hypothetical protein
MIKNQLDDMETLPVMKKNRTDKRARRYDPVACCTSARHRGPSQAVYTKEI